MCKKIDRIKKREGKKRRERERERERIQCYRKERRREEVEIKNTSFSKYYLGVKIKTKTGNSEGNYFGV